MNVLEFSATFSVLFSCLLGSIPIRIAQYINALGNFLWILYSYNHGMKFLMIQSIVIICTNIYACYSWKKKGIPMFYYKERI
jgi:hypothetical protein